MSFGFSPLDFSNMEARRQERNSNLMETMDRLRQFGNDQRGWAAQAAERQAAEEKARQAEYSLQQKKNWLNQNYKDYDWYKYGPAAGLAVNGMNNATNDDEWQTNFNNLATSINMFEQGQQRSNEQIEAAKQAALENEFAQDMQDFNAQDWSQANIGGQLYGQNIDPEIASPEELKQLQKILGIKATGKWDGDSSTAYKQARAAYDAYQQIENDLKNKYGAKKFYDSMNEANQQRLLERAFQNNAKNSYIAPQQAWSLRRV